MLADISKGRIEAYSPMRHKDYLRNGQPVADSYEQLGLPLSTQRGITARDRFDCTVSDLVLFNFLGATRVSIGTMIEIGWADASRVPMIMAMEDENNLHDHAMVRECIPFRVKTLEEAVLLCHHILLP